MTVSEEPDFVGPMYFDASALLKVYVPSQFSKTLNRTLRERTDLFVSELSVTEVTAAICRLRREGVMTHRDIKHVHDRLLLDVAEGIFEQIELTTAVHRDTEKFLLAAEGIELRAGDALHLALAIAAKCRTMITYDRRLAEASRRYGLIVYPE